MAELKTLPKTSRSLKLFYVVEFGPPYFVYPDGLIGNFAENTL